VTPVTKIAPSEKMWIRIDVDHKPPRQRGYSRSTLRGYGGRKTTTRTTHSILDFLDKYRARSKSILVFARDRRPKPLVRHFGVWGGQCPQTTQRTTMTRSIYPAQRNCTGQGGFRLERGFRLASQHFMRGVPNTRGGSPSEVDVISAHIRHDPARCAIN
jgi:hypothetical protein